MSCISKITPKLACTWQKVAGYGLAALEFAPKTLGDTRSKQRLQGQRQADNQLHREFLPTCKADHAMRQDTGTGGDHALSRNEVKELTDRPYRRLPSENYEYNYNNVTVSKNNDNNKYQL